MGLCVAVQLLSSPGAREPEKPEKKIAVLSFQFGKQETWET